MDRSGRIVGRSPDDRLGSPFILLLVWLGLEYGRPTHPLGIPLIISAVLFVAWLSRRDKQWGRFTPGWLVLLGVMALGIPFAVNNYSAFWAARDMAVLFLCVCLPLQAFVTSVRKIRLWLYTFLAVAVYSGGWAASHSGFGAGGLDENYVAALMGMAVGIAYFMLFSERRLALRLLLGLSIVVFLSAVAAAFNPSRGGFIGLCAVGLYCLYRSPRKLLGAAVLAMAAGVLLMVAGPAFWAEISTSTDYKGGTGDIRLEIWKCGVRMWEANPFIGVGPGNFRWTIGEFQSAEQFAKFGRSFGGAIVAHSFWVEMLAELGALGVITTVALIWSTWRGLGMVQREIKRAGPSSSDELRRLSCYADAIRVGIVATLVNGVFLSLFYYSQLWLLLALGSALPFVYGKISADHGGARDPRSTGNMHRMAGRPRIARPISP